MYIYIYIYTPIIHAFSPNASVQWQPDVLTSRIEKWLLGAGFLGAPPVSLTVAFCVLRYLFIVLSVVMVISLPPFIIVRGLVLYAKLLYRNTKFRIGHASCAALVLYDHVLDTHMYTYCI